MNYNINGLKKASTNIGTSKEALNQAMTAFSKINIPDDFIYRSNLKNIPSKLKSISSSIRAIGSWMDSIANKLEEAKKAEKKLEEQIKNKFNDLDVSNLQFPGTSIEAPREDCTYEPIEQTNNTKVVQSGLWGRVIQFLENRK